MSAHRPFRHSLAFALVAIGACTAADASAQATPLPTAQGCRGERDEARLTTTVVFPDGYAVQARWRLLDYAALVKHPHKTADVQLEIDTVTEGSAARGWREHSHFDPPVRLRLVRTALEEITGQAIESWCRIVETMRVLSPGSPISALSRIT